MCRFLYLEINHTKRCPIAINRATKSGPNWAKCINSNGNFDPSSESPARGEDAEIPNRYSYPMWKPVAYS